MSSFCKQCSINLFGKDFGDFKGLKNETLVLCEGCGPIQVDSDGACLSKKSKDNSSALLDENYAYLSLWETPWTDKEIDCILYELDLLDATPTAGDSYNYWDSIRKFY